jgi:hypothetical protein
MAYVRTGNITFGYRAYDDEGGTYHNAFETIPDDDLEFLKLVLESGVDEQLSAMLDYCRDTEHGLYIGDTWYEWDKVKSILNSDSNDAIHLNRIIK